MAYSYDIHIEYKIIMIWINVRQKITRCLANSAITVLVKQPNALQKIFYTSNNNSIP